MLFKLDWWKSGFISSGSVLTATLLAAMLCSNTESIVCRNLGYIFDLLNVPARLMTDWLLHGIGHTLGQQRAGPDTVVAPHGVAPLISALGWLAFLIYWFVVGVGIYHAARLLKWSKRHVRQVQ